MILEWDSDTEMYEAIVDGKKIEVSNDEFSEVEAVHLQDALDKGMSPEQAEKQAWDETRSVWGWLDNGHEIAS